jgi:hypothetical protein
MSYSGIYRSAMLITHTLKNATAGYGSDSAYNASYTLSRTYRDLAGEDFCAITDHYLFTPDPGVEGIIYIPGVEIMAIDGNLVVLNISVAQYYHNNSARAFFDNLYKRGQHYNKKYAGRVDRLIQGYRKRGLCPDLY